jgi:repressor LexA
MIEEQIRSGDLVVIEERKAVREGESVVALIDGTEATLKRFFRDGDLVRLEPANETMKPLFFPAERVHLQGVVVAVIRKY